MSAPRLVGLPAPAQLSDYEAAELQFLALATPHPWVDAILQIGEVAIPGISDIDYIVLLRDEMPVGGHREIDVSRLPPATQRLFLHPNFLVPSSLAPDLFRMTSIFQHRALKGAAPTPRSAGAEEARAAGLVEMVDLGVIALLRDVAWLTTARPIHARYALARLNSMKYPILRAQDRLNVQDSAWNTFVSEFRSFRARWFDLPPEEAREGLLAFAARAQPVAMELTEAIAAGVSSEEPGIVRAVRDARAFTGDGCRVVFTQEWEPREAWRRTLRLSRAVREPVVLLPSALAASLAAYAASGSLMGGHVRRHLDAPSLGEAEVSPFAAAARGRIGLHSAQMEFLKARGAPHGQFFSFGYSLHEHAMPLRQRLVLRARRALRGAAFRRGMGGTQGR